MKKQLIGLLAVMCMLPCLALANGWGTLFEPPGEVLEHIARRWSGYELEDYCEIKGTTKGDFGFALLKSADERLMVGYHKKDGKMDYWLKNAGAVPQASAPAEFFVSQKGLKQMDAAGNMHVDDGLTFGVISKEEIDEITYYEEWVRYHWQNNGFALTGYKQGMNIEPMIEVKTGLLTFSDENGEVGARIYGEIQRDIRYVSWNALPKGVKAARNTVTDAPGIVIGNFRPKKIQFAGEQKYPVYTGPGEGYERSGNGKGQVSTNDWIEVFGEYEGYIMIQYDISAEQYRIGWIDADALPAGADVPNLYFEKLGQRITKNCVLTDDPLKSGKKILNLKKGTEVLSLADFGEYFYIEVIVDGKQYCGFVDADCVTKG